MNHDSSLVADGGGSAQSIKISGLDTKNIYNKVLIFISTIYFLNLKEQNINIF